MTPKVKHGEKYCGGCQKNSNIPRIAAEAEAEAETEAKSVAEGRTLQFKSLDQW